MIRFRLGWFVGEHGVGGTEYSVASIVTLLFVAANDRNRDALRYSVDSPAGTKSRSAARN
ncbi:MAG: hypothetical protein LH610_04620 [Sphingomonas bacterium]|nr:hypothetical protein [Sphingomonas bacterium]